MEGGFKQDVVVDMVKFSIRKRSGRSLQCHSELSFPTSAGRRSFFPLTLKEIKRKHLEMGCDIKPLFDDIINYEYIV